MKLNISATSLVDAVGPAYLDVRGPRKLAVPGVQAAHDLGLRAARHAAFVRPVDGGPTVFCRDFFTQKAEHSVNQILQQLTL